MPGVSTAADASGSVTCTVNESGVPQRIEIAPHWRNNISEESLGPAIVEAFFRSQQARLVTWATEVADLDGEVEPPHDWASRVSVPLLEMTRRFRNHDDVLRREAITRTIDLTRKLHKDAIKMAALLATMGNQEYTGAEDFSDATAFVTGNLSLVRITFRPHFLRRQAAGMIGRVAERAVSSAFEAAQAARQAVISDSGVEQGLQILRDPSALAEQGGGKVR
jgi:hypothetical protein